MGCGCEKNKKADKKCDDFTKAVINIENPEVLTLFHKVVIPASMGDEESVPPAIGKYCNTLLYYEASGNAYLYSSDGIPTKITIPGKDGKDGKDGADGADGRDGVIQYTAGTGISISAQNVISATGSASVAWGDINGNISNQTDLSDALAAKQGTLTAGANIAIDADNVISATDTTYTHFTGTDGQTDGTQGLVPGPLTTDYNKFLSADGTWQTPPGTTYTAGANITIDANNEISATDTTYSNFTGTDGVSAGTAGLVPGPTTSDTDKYLKSDGTWATVASGGSTITMTDTDPGEGSPLAADNYIGVYGGAPFNDDYATAEIDTGTTWIDGKEIYKKTINIAPLPNATNKVVAHNISDLDRVIKLEGYGYRSSDQGTFPLPFVSTNTASAIAVSIAGANVSIVTGQDRSNVTEAYVTLYYTKALI